MRHPQGLASNAAFQVAGRPAFSTSALYYDGNSQGGILGGALAAIAPDHRRAALGVPGMNFSILLTRSSNWKTYRVIFDPAYKDQATHPLACLADPDAVGPGRVEWLGGAHDVRPAAEHARRTRC